MDILMSLMASLSRGIPGLVVAGLSIILMFFALIKKDSGMMAAAALLVLAATFVAGSWTGVLLLVRLMPLFVLVSAYFISRDEIMFAWILPLPAFGYLFYFVFNLVVSNFGGV